MSKRKNEETQLAVGEALCFAFGGVAPSAADVLFGSFTTLEGANKLRLGDDAEADEKNAAEADEKKKPETPETPGVAPIVGASAASAAAKIPAAAAPAAMAVPTPNDTACEAILSAIFDAYLYSPRPRSGARRARGCWRSSRTRGATRRWSRCSPRSRRRSGACWATRTS